LAQTLDSIKAAGLIVEPILVGGPVSAAMYRVGRPRDLANAMASSPQWLLPINAGDTLATGALTAYAEIAPEATDSSVVYADDDLLLERRRVSPHFKPDWNPELFEHHDYVTGSSIVRADRDMLARLPDEGWAEALTRSAIERGSHPVHIKRLLHHRRSRPRPIPPEMLVQALESPEPNVTAIIPTRNEHQLLRACIRGLKTARYPRIETIIVDNGSNDPATLSYLADLEREGAKVLRMPGPFNYSALNNAAVRHANGDLLCFLNNDVETEDARWLALLVRHAVRPDIGAVGARLLYPDGTIQHAGVFTGIGGGAGHAHRFQRADDPGYFSRALLPQRVSAVTAACMVVAREKFLAVGGFDEENFPVAFNDVDLCLKLNRRGWQSFYEPRSTLIHHESKSRGSDRARRNRERFAGELAALKRVWNTDQFVDPYHHPNLSPFCEQFLVAL
jgi:GT2 family glycosyltransferase